MEQEKTWTLYAWREEIYESRSREGRAAEFTREQCLNRQQLVKRMAELLVEEYDEMYYVEDVYFIDTDGYPSLVGRDEDIYNEAFGLTANYIERTERDQLAKLKAKYEA